MARDGIQGSNLRANATHPLFRCLCIFISGPGSRLVKRAAVDLATVDLDNCHKEPIHIPGHVQPHGVLLALDFSGYLTHRSRNAADLLPDLPPLGTLLGLSHLGSDPALWNAIESALHDAETLHEDTSTTVEATIHAMALDVVVHTFDRRVIVELERRQPEHGDLASFALMAHRAMGRLRSRRDVATMLAEATTTIRALTGFDRVLAYRFQHDDSGEIVAEAKIDRLKPYLNRRFPAADIPVQARLLYVRNPLRLIANVHDEQVPIDTHDVSERPLDLSHSMLRSVSPIHIEYLKNIEVAASMSLSIVVAGRLWGLIACHHGEAHLVPYATRMACDVLSQVLSSSVQTAVERKAGIRRLGAAQVQRKLADSLAQQDNFAEGFAAQSDALRQVLPFDSAACSYGGTQWADSAMPVESVSPLLRWLETHELNLVSFHDAKALPAPLRAELEPLCGVLAFCFDRINKGWIVLLRREQIQKVTWSGPPDKVERMGPHGKRLTPAGSMAEWQQDVEGTSLPWDDADQAIARALLEELGRTAGLRAARNEMARSQLLAVLGHDLRDPLQTISMMGQLLERSGVDTSTQPRFGKRITESIGRMQRLIGDVFDMSRLHAGLGLGLRHVPGDLAALIRGLVDDALVAHPLVPVIIDLPDTLVAEFDADRVAQAVGNLVSNARNHGIVGEKIWVKLGVDGRMAIIEISNTAPAIAADAVATLFDAFKPQSVGNVRNPGGLGLGLYIASEVAKGHQGGLAYSHDGERVCFRISIPLVQRRLTSQGELAR